MADSELRGCAVRAQLSREPPPGRELLWQAYNQVRQNPIVTLTLSPAIYDMYDPNPQPGAPEGLAR